MKLQTSYTHYALVLNIHAEFDRSVQSSQHSVISLAGLSPLCETKISDYILSAAGIEPKPR